MALEIFRLSYFTPQQIFLGCFVGLIGVLLFRLRQTSSEHVKIFVGKSKKIQWIVDQCQILQKPYRTRCWNAHGIIETGFAYHLRPAPNVTYVRKCLITPRKGTICLDWEYIQHSKGLKDDAPILVIVPGLNSNSAVPYIQHMVQQAMNVGIRCVVFNHKGSPGTPVTIPEFHSASFTDDFRLSVIQIQNSYPKAKLLAVGYSIGANILIRYVSEQGDNCPFIGIVSLANPFNLPACGQALRKGMAPLILDRSITQSFMQQLEKSVPLFRKSHHINVAAGLKAKNLYQLEKYVIAPMFGWGSAEEYREGSCSDEHVQHVRVPMLVVNAANDPISPVDAVPIKNKWKDRKDSDNQGLGEQSTNQDEGTPRSPTGQSTDDDRATSSQQGVAGSVTGVRGLCDYDNVVFAITPRGGHLAWCTLDYGVASGGWDMPVVVEFVQAVIRAHESEQ